MATEIYLGYPPENIKKWIKAEAERKYQEMLKTPLTFTAEEPNAKISFNKGTEDNQIVISTDKQNWSNYEYETEITLVNVGDKVYFRAADNIENWTFNAYQFYTYGKIAASGNLNTLLKADGSVLNLTGRDYCYTSMFYNCTSLTKAPELPATILNEFCYSNMFYNCTSLTKAPELPATELVGKCYSYMFYGCTTLTGASFPNLEKDTVATEVVERQSAFCDAAPDIETTCKDGTLIINSTAV
jgi:hypothetical protein